MTAISAANIAGSGVGVTAGSSGATGSVAWGSASQLIIGHLSWIAGTTDNITLTSATGPSLTWTDIGLGRISQVVDGTFSVHHQVLRCVGNTNSEALTMNFSGTFSYLRAHFTRLSGDMDLGGTNGSNAIVQALSNTGTSATPSNTLAAFADATNNACLASWAAAIAGVSADSTPKSGFTELHDFAQATQALVYTEWRLGQDTSPNYTSGQGSVKFAGIALEIKAATSNNAAAISNYLRQMRG